MTIMELTTIVLIKSLWWIVPLVGGTVIMAIIEAKEKRQDEEGFN